MLDIRPIEPHEWPTYRELRLRSLQEDPDAFGSTYDLEKERPDDFWSSRIRDSSASGWDRVFLARADDEACGLAWCKVAPATPQVAQLFQMWVAPERRHQGVGSLLLKAAIAWASSVGVKALRLGVAAGDTPAVRLYMAHGFVRVGQLEPLRAGSTLKAQTMELALSAV